MGIYPLLTAKLDKPLSIKQIANSARTMTLTYVISLALLTSLSIFVYFSLDKIIIEESTYTTPTSTSTSIGESQNTLKNYQKANELPTIQRLILIIIVLSVLINGVVD